MTEPLLGSRQRDRTKAARVLDDDEVERLLAEAEEDDDEKDEDEEGS
jgi:hypothetical protein